MTWAGSAGVLGGARKKRDRAVIDIGSNTVRLVIFSGSMRAPEIALNEKVAARLGRELDETGLIPQKAADIALSALRRYRALTTDFGADQLEVVATAAVRDAKNGPEFLEEVKKIGLPARLLSGEEEARASASGVIAAFPGARGVVADLGGGSLELISFAKGASRKGESLPLGTLRLGSLRAGGPETFDRAVEQALADSGWAVEQPGPLYLVGGTWRALAKYAMLSLDHPLSDPHGLTLPVEEADRIAKKLMLANRESLRAISGISSLRAAALPDAAALLRAMLAELKPTELTFSSWGLREGLLYQRLAPLVRKQDPLLAGIAQFTAPRGGSISRAAIIAGWTADPLPHHGKNSERLRLAATLLALAAARLEVNIRTRHALDWALHKRWIGLDMTGRAVIGAALVGAAGRRALPSDLLALASEEDLHDALGWGLAIRLCCRLGGVSGTSLANSMLFAEEGNLVLALDKKSSQLLGDVVQDDLGALAGWLGMHPDVRVGTKLPLRPI